MIGGLVNQTTNTLLEFRWHEWARANSRMSLLKNHWSMSMIMKHIFMPPVC